MEQQKEEKKIEVYKSQSKSSSSSFPLDPTSEIFLRLPEKSILRFRCVSKRWSSIPTDPGFINLFKARSPPLLLCFHAKDKLFVFSIPQNHLQTVETWNESYSSSPAPIDSYHIEFPRLGTSSADFYRPMTESVQGLICFQDDSATPIVWNPSTRQRLTLAKPCMSWTKLTIFLGYDPVESKHKVMCIPYSESSDECRVLTLGSAQESWRTVKTNLNLCSKYYTFGRCINGVIYYITNDCPRYSLVLVSFDVRSEKFNKIELPHHNYMMIVYQGRLACVDRNPNRNNGIRLWILEDAEKHKWSCKDFLAPLDYREYRDTSLETYFLIKEFTHTREFMYVERMFPQSVRFLFCDPVINSFRRFELKGITDDEESVLNNYYRLYVFSNHVESRVCL